MIKFLLLFFLITSLILFICYENQSVIMDFYSKKIVNPRSWGKIEVVQDQKVTGLKDIFESTLVWQALEQLIGFVTGVLICVLIGWRVKSYRNIHEKSFDTSMLEWYQRQNLFEKKLSALELQIVDFERRYLFTKKEAASKSENAPIEERRERTKETIDKNNQDGQNENLASRAFEMILKQSCDESNLETTLNKLNIMLESLSKLNEEYMLTKTDRKLVETDTDLLHEQDCRIEDTVYEEYYKKENFDIENKADEIVLSSEEINEDEYQNETCQEEMTENFLCPEFSSENSPYELHQCNSNEKLVNAKSIAGAGECEETFRGKIVPVSQIPQYQELRKNHRQKTKVQKEYEDDKIIPFITADEVMAERVTPQTTPRKNTSVYAENSVDRKGGRRKQRAERS